MAREQNMRIIGVHLAGPSTRKTAVVRASGTVRTALSGMPEGAEHDVLKSSLQAYFPQLEVEPLESHKTYADCASPLFWEVFTSDLGPSSHQDADARLLQAIEDLGGADVFCIDAPLTLPPCVQCSTFGCREPKGCDNASVALMKKLWEERRQTDRKARSPLPYLDRYFEVFARSTFEHPGFTGSFEIEAPMGSNRAPLTARSIHLSRQLTAAFPKALILETNSLVSALGWSLHSGYKLSSLLELKNNSLGTTSRAGLLKRLEQKRFATRSAMLHEDIFSEFYGQTEIFLAAMGALSAWGLFLGEVLVTKEFLALEPGTPLRGWACVPKDVAQYAWGH